MIAPDGELLDGFVAGVAAEWERERAAHDVRRLHTLYLGGGTPSLLGPDRLERLLELFRPHLTPGAEVTVEANPEDVDDAFAAWAAPRRAPASGAAAACASRSACRASRRTCAPASGGGRGRPGRRLRAPARRRRGAI